MSPLELDQPFVLKSTSLSLLVCKYLITNHFLLIYICREHLLERAITTLVNPGNKAEDGHEEGGSHSRTTTPDVLRYLQTLQHTFSAPPGAALHATSRDEVSP